MKRNAKFIPKNILLAAFLALATTTTQAACTPPPAGLVAWWQAEGSAIDFVGTNHGSLSGSGAGYATGKVGQGFRFDGTNGYVSIPDASALKPANITVEAWVWLDPNTTPTSQVEVIVFKKNSRSYLFEGYNLAKEHVDNGDGTFTDRFTFVIAGSSGSQVVTRGTTAVQRGVWYHVAGTYDGNKATIWVNGAAENSNLAGFALDYGTRPVFIGATGEASPYDNFLAGIIDEASIYNRALATNEIAAIYNAGVAGKCFVTAPFIVAQPTNRTVLAGSSASFTATAGGSLPLSYRWRLNNVNVSGGTNSTLTLFNVQPNQAGNYSVLVTNLYGAIISSNALLTVNPVTPTCTPPPSGLVGWWQGNGNAIDRAAGNNGVAVNVGYTTGEVGQTFSFDPENYSYGTYTGVQIPDSPAYALTNSLSIEGWIRPRGNGGYVIFTRGDHRPGLDSYTLSMNVDGIIYFSITDDSGNTATLQVPVTMNQWMHVAATLDGGTGTMNLYTNGVVAAQTVTTIHPIGQLTGSSPGVGIGNLNDGGNTFPFEGDIDEIALYNRALSAVEVQAIHDAGSAGKCTSSPPVCTPPPSGLVSWWPAEGNATDVIGGNNGTLQNGAAIGAGKVQQGFRLTGAGDFIKIPRSPSLDVGGQITIEFWMKADPTNDLNTYQGLLTSDFYGVEIANGYVAGSLGVNFFLSTDGGASVSPTSYPDTATPNGGGAVVSAGQWHHVAATYDGSKLQLYIDGQPWGVPNYHTGPISPMLTNSYVAIGAEDGRTICPDCVTNRYFNGLIDEPSIYNRALSTNEILAIYNAGSAGKCLIPFAPVVTIQPTNQTVLIGSTATLSATASGTQPLTYQWAFNGSNISNATSSSLSLTNVQVNQAGNYVLLVTNNYGSAISSNAVLTVILPTAPPVILSQPPSQVVQLGSSATFTVNASGSDPLSYFWKRDGAFISGATNPTYIFNNSQLSDSGSKFACLVTNVSGFSISTNATLKVIDTVSNDLCSGAVVITSFNYTNLQSTTKATSFGDPVPGCTSGFGNGVWYQFTAPINGLLIVDTFGSDFDTGLAIYSGSCDSLAEIACNDDTGGLTSQVAIAGIAGTTYSILVGGYSAHAGNLVVHLNYLTPPVFASQPTNQSVVVSSNASFAATITGSQPMGLQWYFNNLPLADGAHINGSTNATLNIVGVLTNDAGNYQLVASNLAGVTTSSVAVLTPVILPPMITLQPVGQSILTGSNVTFFAAVDGTPPYSFQWYFNNNPLSDDGVRIFGSQTGSLSISNLTTADGGNYSLIVTNVSGTAISELAALTVLVPPAILTQPIGRSVPPGLPTTFNVTATGNPVPTYRWLLNGTNVPGANISAYTIPAVGTNQLGFYQVAASNSAGTTTSSVAPLTFGPVAAWGRNFNNELLPPPNLNNVVGIAGTFGASFAVGADGHVTAWGGGSVTNLPTNVSNVVAISSFANYANIALRSDGTVVGWGGAPPPVLSNIVSVAAGFSFAYALRAEGTVTGWGNPLNPSFPVGLNHLTAVAAGGNNALALRNDGTIFVAGAGPITNVPSGATNVVSIAVGDVFAMALRTDGKLFAWGSGSGTNLPASMTNIVSISAGNYRNENFGVAIRANGRVVSWGDNSNGETNPPPALTNLFSIVGAAPAYHGLALVNDGSPVIIHPPIGLTTYTGRDVILHGDAVGATPLSYQWLMNGTNLPGATNTILSIPNVQLSDAGSYQLFASNNVGTALSISAPLNVISNNTLTILSQVTASPTNLYQGGKFTVNGLTVLGSGPLRYQWFFSPTNKNYTLISFATNDTLVMDPALAGNTGNYYLAISNQVGGITSAPVTVRVLFAKAWGFQAITNPPVNVTNAVAIATGGYQNYNGHYLVLGADGKLSSWANYLATYGETNVSALSNSIVTAIAAGSQHSLALKSDGTVYAWGYGFYGQTNPPAGLNGVTAIACGDFHDLALRADGTVVAWGQNTYGQATNNPAATNVVAIAAGTRHSLALRADGSVIGWSIAQEGATTTPINATNVIAIAAGTGFSAALRANGTVVQWGSTMTSYPVPATLSNVVAISASGSHVTALKNDGTVVSWGYEYINLASNNVPSDLSNVIAIASGGDHDIALFGTRAPAFTVQPWNRAVTLNPGTQQIISVSLAGKCAGVQPMSYQWRLNGTNYPGATNDILNLRYDLPQTPAGTFQLVASNSYGIAISKPAKVTIVIPLAVALDTPADAKGNSTYNWLTSGGAQWFGETNITHDGVDAARSGGIGALQETILQTTFSTNFAGHYTFWWKVSSEQFFDTLEFRVNGTVQAVISGEVDWQQANIAAPAGTNVLQWRYSKDGSFDTGLDAAFVDQFAFVNDPPVITNQPAGIVANLGATVSLSVAAVGAPQLKYEWRQNGNVIGGNSPTLVLNNVARAQDGIYSVTVTNTSGIAVSSNAVVQVLVPQILGTPVMQSDGTLQMTSTDANGGLLSSADLTNFEAQASTNMVDWVTLPDALSLTNGMLQLQDAGQTNFAARYYRIIEH